MFSMKSLCLLLATAASADALPTTSNPLPAVVAGQVYTGYLVHAFFNAKSACKPQGMLNKKYMDTHLYVRIPEGAQHCGHSVKITPSNGVDPFLATVVDSTPDASDYHFLGSAAVLIQMDSRFSPERVSNVQWSLCENDKTCLEPGSEMSSSKD